MPRAGRAKVSVRKRVVRVMRKRNPIKRAVTVVKIGSSRSRQVQRYARARAANPFRAGTMIGAASMPIQSKPTNMSIKSSRGGQAIRVQGTEFLGPIQVPAGETVDTLYRVIPNGAGPTSTRLACFASIYERWRPYRYTYRFMPSVGSTTPGTIIMAQDPDPAAQWLSGNAGNAARMRAIPGSVMQQVYIPARVDLPSTRDYTTLWTLDPEPSSTSQADRLDLAGQLLVGCAAKTNLASGTTLGTLELEYDIEYYSPKLSSAAVSRSSEFKISGAAAQAVRAATASGTRSVINELLTVIQSTNTTGIFDAGGAVNLISTYAPLSFTAFDEKTEEKGRIPCAPVNDSGGWTAGLLSISLYVVSTAVVNPVTAAALVSHGNKYENGTDAMISAGTWNAPDGTHYTRGQVAHLDFAPGETETRGFADVAVAYDALAATDLTFWLIIRNSSAPDFQPISTVGVARKSVTKTCLFARVDDELSDIEDAWPPRAGAGPSTAPGGSAYVPSSTSAARYRVRPHISLASEPDTPKKASNK